MHTIQIEGISDLWEELDPLLNKHWREVAHFQDIPLNPDRDLYRQLDEAGTLRTFTARIGDRLVGYLIYFIKHNPHYKDSLQAVQDVFFVDPELRGSRVGSDLLVYSHSQLAVEGVQVVAQHVKVKHDFGPLLERLGYEHVEAVYCKRLDY